MREMKGCLPVFLIVGFLVSVTQAGTVTVDRVYADGIYVRDIGVLPAKKLETLYYPFSNDGGGTAEDASDNGYDGAVSGAVWTNAGPYGASMFFDGSGDYIDVGSAPNFPAWNQYSVSVWFMHNGGGYLGGSQYGQKIVDKTSMYHDWHIYLWPCDSNGGVGFSTYENGVSRGMGDGSRNYMDSVWHHVSVIRDGTNGQLWIDGVLKVSCNNMISVNSSSDVCIGNSFSSDSYQRTCWSGMIDEVRIYGRAITSNEVIRLYTEGFLPNTNVSQNAVFVSTNLVVGGGLTVTGKTSFAEGVFYARPLGDLSLGIYTNAP